MTNSYRTLKNEPPITPENQHNRHERMMLRREQNLISQRRRHTIAALSDEGMSSDQIAEKLGITKRRVNRIAKKAGLKIGKQGGTRRVGAWLDELSVDNIAVVAEEAGVSRSAMVARSLRAMYRDIPTAKKFLGKDAQPKRGYGRPEQ